MEFGEKVRKLRKEKKMTQQEVADAAKITVRAYIEYEKGNAKPRKKETYERLAKVLECNIEYLLKDDASVNTQTIISIAKAATAITGVAAGVVSGGSVPVISLFSSIFGILMSIEDGLEEDPQKALTEKDTNTKSSKTASISAKNNSKEVAAIELFIKKYQQKKNQLSASTMGIILNSLSQKGIICQTEISNSCEGDIIPDKSIKLIGQNIENWWFVFFPMIDSKYLNENTWQSQIKNDIPNLISRFALTKPDPKKMVSIIVDNPEVYEQLYKYKNHNSYRGNMSVILIDTTNVRVAKEVILSSYFDNETENVIKIL